jgi:hypothetical protein
MSDESARAGAANRIAARVIARRFALAPYRARADAAGGSKIRLTRRFPQRGHIILPSNPASGISRPELGPIVACRPRAGVAIEPGMIARQEARLEVDGSRVRLVSVSEHFEAAKVGARCRRSAKAPTASLRRSFAFPKFVYCLKPQRRVRLA